MTCSPSNTSSPTTAPGTTSTTTSAWRRGSTRSCFRLNEPGRRPHTETSFDDVYPASDDLGFGPGWSVRSDRLGGGSPRARPPGVHRRSTVRDSGLRQRLLQGGSDARHPRHPREGGIRGWQAEVVAVPVQPLRQRHARLRDADGEDGRYESGQGVPP